MWKFPSYALLSDGHTPTTKVTCHVNLQLTHDSDIPLESFPHGCSCCLWETSVVYAILFSNIIPYQCTVRPLI